jgi:ribose transport system permease protein
MVNSKRFTLLHNTAFPSLIILLILFIINAVLQPNFFSFYTLKLNLLTFTPLILAGIAQAYIILIGAVDLSLGANISLVSVVMASLMGDSFGSILFAVCMGIITAVLMSAFNGFFISVFNPPPLIMTFATSTIWFGIALFIMPTPGGYIPKVFYQTYQSSVFNVIPVPALTLLLVFLICFFFSKTRFFNHLYAVGGNEKAASASGINKTKVKISTFIISGIFIGLAACTMVAQTATGDARSGLGFTLNSVAACIIGGISFSGGKGNVLGAIVGGLILGLLINIIYFANITSMYQELMKGVVIIIALVIGAIPRIRKEIALSEGKLN